MKRQHRTVIRAKRIIIPLLGGLLLAFGAENASARSVMDRCGASAQASPVRALAGLPGFFVLGMEECGLITGGDVRMVLNASRTRLTVNVIDNEYEARLGRIPPREVYELDVHNRVVRTNGAPFMPTPESRRELGGLSGLTTAPSAFPEGNWLVTSVKSRTDKFGPYMIGTGAIGQVDVYLQGSGEGSAAYLGRYMDIGYALHANTQPFEYSKSYGCLVLRQADLTRLAETLQRDRKENGKAMQTIRVKAYGDR